MILKLIPSERRESVYFHNCLIFFPKLHKIDLLITVSKRAVFKTWLSRNGFSRPHALREGFVKTLTIWISLFIANSVNTLYNPKSLSEFLYLVWTSLSNSLVSHHAIIHTNTSLFLSLSPHVSLSLSLSLHLILLFQTACITCMYLPLYPAWYHGLWFWGPNFFSFISCFPFVWSMVLIHVSFCAFLYLIPLYFPIVSLLWLLPNISLILIPCGPCPIWLSASW